MAASFRSAGTWAFTPNNVASPATLAPGAPSGVVPGDCLVLVCESRSNTATVATPSGWTLVSGFPKASGTTSGGTIYVFVRTADGSASDTPSPVWSGLTTGTSGDASGAGLLAYSGLSTTLDGTVQVSDLSAQTTTSVIPAFTTGKDGSIVIGVCIKLNESSGQTSTVATFTERADNSTTSGTGHIVEVSDKTQASAGSSGTATVTWSATTSARALAVSLGLQQAVPEDFESGWPLALCQVAITAGLVAAATFGGMQAAQNALAVGQDEPYPQPIPVAEDSYRPPFPSEQTIQTNANLGLPYYSSDEDVLYIPPQPASYGFWTPPARRAEPPPVLQYQFTGDDFKTPARFFDEDAGQAVYPLVVGASNVPIAPWITGQDDLPIAPPNTSVGGGVLSDPSPVRYLFTGEHFPGVVIPLQIHDDGIVPPPPQRDTSWQALPQWFASGAEEAPQPFILPAFGAFQQPPQTPQSVPVLQYRFTGEERPIPPAPVVTDDDPWVSGVAPDFVTTTIPLPWSWEEDDWAPQQFLREDETGWIPPLPQSVANAIPLPWDGAEEWPHATQIVEDSGYSPPIPPAPSNLVPQPWQDGDEVYPHVVVQLDDLGWIPPLPQNVNNTTPQAWDPAEEWPHLTTMVDDLGWSPPIIQHVRNLPLVLWVDEIPTGALHGLPEDDGTDTTRPPWNLQTDYRQNVVPVPSLWDDPGLLPVPLHVDDDGSGALEALLQLARRISARVVHPFIFTIQQEDTFEIAPAPARSPTQVVLPTSHTTVTLPNSTTAVMLSLSANTVTIPPSTTSVTVTN